MTLVLEHLGEDFLGRSLSVAEPRLPGGRHRVKLLVGEVSEWAERLPPGVELLDQLGDVNVLRAVSVFVAAVGDVTALTVAVNKSRNSQVGVGHVYRDGRDCAVTELFAAGAWVVERGFICGGEKRGQVGDLPVPRFEHLATAVAHRDRWFSGCRVLRRR